jgi:hypothetical protein
MSTIPESSPRPPEQVEELIASPELARAVENEEFKWFLDHVPIAIVISRQVGNRQRGFSVELAGQGLAAFGVAAMKNDASTLGHHAPGNRLADAGRTAGDENDFVVESHPALLRRSRDNRAMVRGPPRSRTAPTRRS